MRIAIAQLNGTIGDFPGNAKRIIGAYREALDQGAELVVTPEMSLAGYPPRDMVFKSQFVPKCLQALDYLAGEIGEVPLLVGYVDRNEADEPGKPFRNAAALLADGKVVARVFKTLLPTYDVFDERRYYEPWEKCVPVVWNGVRMGITICEDLWTEDYLHRPLYKRDPVEELHAAGVDVLINLSASPFHVGKPAVRRKLLGEVAVETGVPVVYCNSVAGNDSLIFDGHSVAVGRDGSPLVQMPGFEERVEVVDLASAPPVVVVDECDQEEIHGAHLLHTR